MSNVFILVKRWMAAIDLNGGPSNNLGYPPSDGRFLAAFGSCTLGPIKDIECEISFHSAKSNESKKHNCDGFAELWDDGTGTVNMRGHLDLSPPQWQELWTAALLPGVRSAVLFTLLDGENGGSFNELLRLKDPIVNRQMESRIL